MITDILKTPLAKIGLGVLGGGALGTSLGIGTTAGQVLGGIGAASPSPLGKAIGIGSTAANVASMFKPDAPIGTQVGKTAGGSIGAEAGVEPTAIDRAIESNPMPQVHTGLALANDKSLPLDYDTRMSVIEPLLRAKHFGYGGGLANG